MATKLNTAVTFVHGTQTTLNTKGITSGQIYFTTDTNRLYWADPSDSGTLKWIDGVRRANSLPSSPGSYNPSGSILVVTQSDDNGAQDGVYIADDTSWIKLDATTLNSSITTDNNTAHISLTPQGKYAKGTMFDIKGDGNVTISSDSSTITISVPTPTNTHLVANDHALSATITNGDLSINMSTSDSENNTVNGKIIINGGSNIHIDQNELGKINRILEKEYPDAYRETLVVLDATTGQNALVQAKEFSEVAKITGIVLTKMDGTAKGGIAVAIQSELSVPVKYIGVGETIDDLSKFDPDEFVNALFDIKKEGEEA